MRERSIPSHTIIESHGERARKISGRKTRIHFNHEHTLTESINRKSKTVRARYSAVMKLKLCFSAIALLSALVVCALLLPHGYNGPGGKTLGITNPLRKSQTNPPRKAHLGAPLLPGVGRNILAIYAGRWEFMRILLPQVYRELKSNGGILDEVWFMMIKADKLTNTKIKNFVQVADKVQGKRIFSIHGKPAKTEDYTFPYYEFFSHLNNFPNDRFFKFDDDIVYIRPRAFNYVVDTKNSSRCFMHFFNIAGSNWRCSWIHQRNGVYNETNPKNLTFDFDPSAACGWKGTDCGVLTIQTFLHHYKKGQLGHYYFKDMELTPDRSRFSINAYMLDKDLIDIKAMLEVGKIYRDDEKWWTVDYSAKVAHPNCIVGEALVVHFAYRVVAKKLLSLGLLKEFSTIVESNMISFNAEEHIWEALEFNTTNILF